MPLTVDQRLRISSHMRFLEQKAFHKACKVLSTYSIILPDRKCMISWKNDKKIQAALRRHLIKQSGYKQTVNPCEWSPSLE
jgi:hypothetical protein